MLGSEAFRDQLPTCPHDLTEYARDQTGPSSWSADPRVASLSAWALEAHDDPMCARTTELLVDISPLDVPRVVVAGGQVAAFVTHREAFVIASIDGASTLEMMVGSLDLPPGEVLEIVCRLCARGIVALDR